MIYLGQDIRDMMRHLAVVGVVQLRIAFAEPILALSEVAPASIL